MTRTTRNRRSARRIPAIHAPLGIMLSAAALAMAGCGGVADDSMSLGPDASVSDPDEPTEPTDPADAGSPDDPADASPPDEPDAEPESCPEGYDGVDCMSCAAEYQDVDGDGVCKLSCEATGTNAFDCNYGTCVEGELNGDRFCECDEGAAAPDCDTCLPGYKLSRGACILDLPDTTNLVLWLDADKLDSFGIGSGYVATWSDRRGGANALQATTGVTTYQPRLISSAINGRYAVRFDGNDTITVSDFPGLKGNDYTVILVLDPAGTLADKVLRAGSIEYGSTFLLEHLNPDYKASHITPLGQGTDSVTGDFTKPGARSIVVVRRWIGLLSNFRMLAWQHGGTTTIDDVDQVDGSNLNVTHSLSLGAGELNGDIGELLIYDRAVPNAELDEIKAYLAAKWGIE